ncbi:MAG: clan AA aspartic protease [Verrucomicrobiaceae bacterium]|nr:clan AA aspartic protease [Verrucomicrobiaceae bacterium]
MMRSLLLLPFLVMTGCVMPPGFGAREHRAGVVLAPMHFRADAPHVMAKLNGGKSLPALLDTGASVCVLEAALAARYDVPLIPGKATNIRGIHGSAIAMRAVIHGLDIGPWHASGVPCYVRNNGGPRFGGLGNVILGIDLMRRHARFVTFDYRDGHVEFGMDVPFVPRARLETTRVPFRWSNGLPMIEVASGALKWDAVVDTGSSWGIVIDQTTAARLGHAKGGSGLGRNMMLTGVGGSVSADDAGARIIRVPSVTLCGRTAPEDLYVMPGPKRIGSAYWHGCRLTLDFSTNTLWLQR